MIKTYTSATDDFTSGDSVLLGVAINLLLLDGDGMTVSATARARKEVPYRAIASVGLEATQPLCLT